jgi:hypothetical protein
MVDKTADSQSTPSPTSNGSTSTDGEPRGSRRLSSYLQSVAQISGVVTIIAATVYALGVFTLVLPIANSYNSTFAAAWYAVSVVPQTVVVGHGMKSLVWPSLALTLATTLFALTMLWLLHTLSVGWRHARAAAEGSTPRPSSMAYIYTFLSVLTIAVVIAIGVAWFGAEAFFAGRYSASGMGSYVVDFVFGSAYLLAAGLCVLSCSAAGVYGVSRWLLGASQLLRSRTFPSMSLKGFIYKGLIFAVLSGVVLFSVWMLAYLYFQVTEQPIPTTVEARLGIGFFISVVLVALFGLAVALFLMVRLLRYTRKAHLIGETIRANFTPIIAPLRDLSAYLAQRARVLSPTFSYSMVLFTMLYLALFIALNTLDFLGFLTDEVRGEIRAESMLDDILIPLVVFGALVSGLIMYRKDWRGFGRSERGHLSQGSWVYFSKEFLKGIGSRSLRSGLLWSLGAAYVFALLWAFLLAQLSPPPLPKVEVNEVGQAQSSSSVQSGQESAFQGKKLALLAHTDGYWYLIDEDEGDLMVVPDQTDKFIRLQLDEQPR